MKTSLKLSNDPSMANPHRRGRSTRYRAWRNLMVAAINAGIQQHVFSLEPIEELPRGGVPYSFTLCGHPVIAHARDIGWDELTISAALCPTPDGRRWLDCFGTGFLAGEADARGWLERRDRDRRNRRASLRRGAEQIRAEGGGVYRVDISDAVRKRAPAPIQVRKAPEQAAPAASEVEETRE